MGRDRSPFVCTLCSNDAPVLLVTATKSPLEYGHQALYLYYYLTNILRRLIWKRNGIQRKKQLHKRKSLNWLATPGPFSEKDKKKSPYKRRPWDLRPSIPLSKCKENQIFGRA